jgi:quercetin dioxygenase-like cupin family protein
MKKVSLEDMKLGWIVGAFTPTAYHTENCEVAIKHYKIGDYDKKHYHKIATEITTIVSGEVKMNDIIYTTGDVLVIDINEATDFLALKPTTTVVVKVPGAKNDKYEV